jgi:hypothetical protein
MMREFMKKKDLMKHGFTQFATSFLTLQRAHKQKHNLRNIFIKKKWEMSKWT